MSAINLVLALGAVGTHTLILAELRTLFTWAWASTPGLGLTTSASSPRTTSRVDVPLEWSRRRADAASTDDTPGWLRLSRLLNLPARALLSRGART